MVQLWLQKVNHWDERLFSRAFGDMHHKTFKRFFYALSRSADSFSCAVLGLIWFLLRPETACILAAGILAFVLELSLYYLIKKSIRRPRPFRRFRGIQYLIAPPDEFSFPSGHTAAAFLMAVLVSTAFPVMVVPVFVWAFLVGFSRIYMGVHYPTDVLAGMVLGMTSAQCGLWMIHLI